MIQFNQGDTSSEQMNDLDLPQAAKHISIEALRMFFILSEVGAISKTAQLINRSQPAVSLQLKKLEQSLDTTLFCREKGQFNLTKSGEILKGYAQKILSLNDDLIEKLSASGNHQIIRLGIPNDFVSAIWEPLSHIFQKTYPNIYLEVYEDISINLIKMLHNNTIDMVIAILPKDGGHYCSYSVAKKLVWVGNEKLLNNETLPLVACFKGCSYRNRIERSLHDADIKFNFVITTNNFQTINSAVEKGVGITVTMEDNLISYKSKLTLSINEKLPPLGPLYIGIHNKSTNMTKELYEFKILVKSCIK